jgi:hypothetical protein
VPKIGRRDFHVIEEVKAVDLVGDHRGGDRLRDLLSPSFLDKLIIKDVSVIGCVAAVDLCRAA